MLIDLKNKFSAKRGISTIVGTLIMVAVVAAIGSVIMFQGLNGINDFNYYLSFLTGSKNSSQENLIIEHVRFNPTTADLDIWVRNTGTVEVEIAKIAVVNMNSQEIVLNEISNDIVPISENIEINEIADLPLSVGGGWEDDPTCVAYDTVTPCPYEFAQYRISITTLSGNTFETLAMPFNT